MYRGLKDVAHRQFYYYVMTYAMPAPKKDGDYHDIKLELTRPGLELSYRKGYYTPKEELAFENSRKEDVMSALVGPGNMSEIPVNLSYNYFQEDDTTYSVSFITKADIRKLRFGKENGRRTNQISFVLVAFDESDRYISGLEKSVEFQLMENSFADVQKHGITSKVDLRLPPGRYKLKAVVRENIQGKIGSINKSVEIP